jgi:hypothetical protein
MAEATAQDIQNERELHVKKLQLHLQLINT